MHPYIHQLTVPQMQAERRRQAPTRRPPRRPRVVRRAGGGMVAVGTALATAGRRLQEPATGPCLTST